MHIKKWVFSATLAASLLAVTNTQVHAQSKLEKRHNEWVFIYNNTIQTKFTGLVQHRDKQWYFVLLFLFLLKLIATLTLQHLHDVASKMSTALKLTLPRQPLLPISSCCFPFLKLIVAYPAIRLYT